MLIPRVRTAVTLLALLVMLLIGVAYGFSAVTEPFPQREAAPVCTDTDIEQGEKVFPDQVTVTVINAGDRAGLASRTMRQLAENDFGRGGTANAPEGTEVERVQIWTDRPRDPDVRLVASYVGNKPEIIRRDTVGVGVNVVVGDEFEDISEGRRRARARSDTTICSPPSTVTPIEDPVPTS